MMPWFVWKDKNSYADFGIWINKLVNRVRPEERHEEIEIPGRAGTLVMLEGDDIYGSYSAEMTVIARNSCPMDKIMAWLRGSGDLILWTDDSKVRKARIVGEVSFERLGNWLQQATIPFLMQPFRYSRYPEKDTITQTGTGVKMVYNPGDVASRPKVTFSSSGNKTVSVGGTDMVFSNAYGDFTIDCDAQLITRRVADYDSSAYYYKGDYAIFDSSTLKKFTDSGTGSTLVSGGKVTEETWRGSNFAYVWPGSYTGEFFRIPAGITTGVAQSTGGTLTVYPNWRWL